MLVAGQMPEAREKTPNRPGDASSGIFDRTEHGVAHSPQRPAATRAVVQRHQRERSEQQHGQNDPPPPPVIPHSVEELEAGTPSSSAERRADAVSSGGSLASRAKRAERGDGGRHSSG